MLPIMRGFIHHGIERHTGRDALGTVGKLSRDARGIRP